MTTILTAVALAVAAPGAAEKPAPMPEMKCCCRDMQRKMACCEERGKADGHEEHQETDGGSGKSR